MLLNYLKVTFRNFFSNGVYTFIIVLGLAIGISVCLIIGQYAQFELSFDQQYKDRDRTFYTYMHWRDSQGERDKMCHPALTPLIRKSVPEVESVVRIARAGVNKDDFLLSREKDGQVLDFGRIENMIRADQETLEFFSIPMIEGDAKTALSPGPKIVITKSLADRFFPNESALNKTLVLSSAFTVTVTGVVPDAPSNSTLKYTAIFPIGVGLRSNWEELWSWPEFRTFVKLAPGSDYEKVQQKINMAAAPELTKIKAHANVEESVVLHPFSDFHFFNPIDTIDTFGIRFTGDKKILGFFVAIASLILIICWVNYINLTIARSLNRAKEVGLRKVNGAARMNLVVQFLLEFFVLNVISLAIGFTITQVAFQAFASAIGTDAQWVLWKYPMFWLIISCFLILSTVVSGIYPAFIMSGYNPVKVLKGKFSRSQGGTLLRKSLVFVQFGLASILLLGIYVISRQLQFLQTSDLGMSPDQVLVIRTETLPRDLRPDRQATHRLWKSEIEKISGVLSASACWTYPGESAVRERYFESQYIDATTKVEIGFVTPGYLKTVDIHLIDGRDFYEENSDSTGVIINEAAVRELGFANPAAALGATVKRHEYGINYEVIGVIEDYYTSTKTGQFSEVLARVGRSSSNNNANYFLVKMSSTNISGSMDALQETWQRLFQSPMEYFFLDTYFDTFYKEERQFAGVFGFFSTVGVIITCMGLFALSMYNTTSRIKEIGIRKSLGGSSGSIMWMFSKEYLSLVLIAGAICIPIGVWLINGWLKSYPNRIDFGIDFILIPLIFVVAIAQTTVAYQTYKASRTNPVNALKYE